MSERQQAEILLKNIPERNLHIVIALMRELMGYEDYHVKESQNQR